MLKLTKNAVWIAVMISLAGLLHAPARAQDSRSVSVEQLVADR